MFAGILDAAFGFAGAIARGAVDLLVELLLLATGLIPFI